MIRILSLLLCLCAFISCKQDTSSTAKSDQDPETIIKTADAENRMSGMPASEIKNIYDNVDQIDYIYHTLPISMALNEDMAVKNNVSFISPSAQWQVPEGCQPLGRQLFYSKGELLIEADLYFDDNCKFLVFIRDEKVLWANKFTPHGIKFYTNLMKQVSGMQQQ